MTLRLDCHDEFSTLRSLSLALNLPEDELVAGFRNYSYRDFQNSPFDNIVARVCSFLGRDADDIRFTEATHFHGTRLVDPGSVNVRGILALEEIVEEIWVMLRGFSGSTDGEWQEFRDWMEGEGGGDWGRLYRDKTSHSMHHGPYAYLVREMVISPLDTDHKYLATPEIVEDICLAWEERGAETDLGALFLAASNPYVVKFRAPVVRTCDVQAAFVFVFSKTTGLELGRNLGGGWNGEGISIPPADILGVEAVDWPLTEIKRAD